MAPDTASGGTLVRLYRNRIGEPSTTDEARGYWVFAVGVFLGVAGVLLFLRSTPGSGLREGAIVAAAAGLVLLLAGPIIRLPVRRVATWLVYLGVVVCAAAILWFSAAFPTQWSTQAGQRTIVTSQVIGVYTVGLLVMAAGGVLVPLLTDPAGLKEAVSSLQAELDGLRDTLRDGEADEDDLAAVIADLRRVLADTEADETDLARLVDDLRGGEDDAEADEADLAARLQMLHESRAQFEVYEDRGGEWRWRLRHRNGNAIADSGEGYTRRHNAQNGLESVRRNALGASVLLFEREDELPEEGTEEGLLFPADHESRATFEIYEDAGDEFRWRLRHDNGNVLADGGEGYASRGGVKTAVDRIRESVVPAEYLRPDPTAFEVYRDRSGEWRWRFVHQNGNVLADSGGGYASRSGARRALDRIRERVDEMESEVYEDNAGEFRWRLRGGNNQIMADSGEGYESRDGAEEAIDRVREYAPDADALDIGRAAFEVYEDRGGEWRWRLRHRNGNILADSGEGYSDRSGTWDGIERVKRNAPGAETDTESK